MQIRNVLLLTSVLLFVACGTNYQVDTGLSEERIAEKKDKIMQLTVDYDKAETNEDKIEQATSIGLEYQLIGDYKSAIKFYEEVLTLHPANFPALNNLAAIYEEVDELDKAIGYEEQLYHNYSVYPQVIEDMIRLYLKNYQPELAQKILNEFSATEKGQTEAPFIASKQEEIDKFKQSQNSQK